MADDPRSRRPDYRFARIVAAGSLTLVVSTMLIVDLIPAANYEVQPVVLVPILGFIAGLLGVEIRSILKGD
ncbi:MAG TPA: hypothetical protein VIU37_00205 [Candidatus Limnocylindrales bacterium]